MKPGRWGISKHIGTDLTINSTMHIRLKILWCLVVMWLGALGSAAAQSPHPPALDFAIHQAQVLVHLDKKPTPIDLGEQKLPFRWDEHYPNEHGRIQLSVSWELSHKQWAHLQYESAGLGLTIPYISSRYRYRLNQGHWREVNWGAPQSGMSNGTAHWHLLPATQLSLGTNILELQINAEAANREGISQIQLGEVNDSFQNYQRQRKLWFYGSILTSSLSLLISFSTLGMWLIYKRKFYLLVSIAEFLFSLFAFLTITKNEYLPTWLWNAFHHNIITASVFFRCLSIIEIHPVELKKIKYTMHFLLIFSMPLLIIFFYFGYYNIFYVLGFEIVMSLTCLIMIYYAVTAIKQKKVDYEYKLLSYCLMISFFVFFYDYLYIDLQINKENLSPDRYSIFCHLLYEAAIVITLVRRQLIMQKIFLKTLKKTHYIRERIGLEIFSMMDVHLLQMKRMLADSLNKEKLLQHIHHTTEEVRWYMDALDPANGDLINIFARIRHRLQPIIKKHGIQLNWHVNPLPKISFGVKDILNLQQMARQVTDNIIKHAKATEITISTDIILNNIIITKIQDNGLGFDSNNTKNYGHGILSIIKICNSINADFKIESYQNKGTIYTFMLDLRKLAALQKNHSFNRGNCKSLKDGAVMAFHPTS